MIGQSPLMTRTEKDINISRYSPVMDYMMDLEDIAMFATNSVDLMPDAGLWSPCMANDVAGFNGDYHVNAGHPVVGNPIPTSVTPTVYSPISPPLYEELSPSGDNGFKKDQGAVRESSAELARLGFESLDTCDWLTESNVSQLDNIAESRILAELFNMVDSNSQPAFNSVLPENPDEILREILQESQKYHDLECLKPDSGAAVLHDSNSQESQHFDVYNHSTEQPTDNNPVGQAATFYLSTDDMLIPFEVTLADGESVQLAPGTVLQVLAAPLRTDNADLPSTEEYAGPSFAEHSDISHDHSFFVKSPRAIAPKTRGKVIPATSSKAPKRLQKQKSTVDRKSRKKEQNREAAARYRLKKQQEKDLVEDELQQLENANRTLHLEVSEKLREINYLKNLLKDVQVKK